MRGKISGKKSDEKSEGKNRGKKRVQFSIKNFNDVRFLRQEQDREKLRGGV